ncbi:MAG: LuxR C-terminal-related transcriptional regulator [Pseudomonadota bacterium]
MSKHLLRPLVTKVMLPRQPAGLIERPRCLAALAPAMEKRLVLVKASAGFGKSALALAWASQLRRAGDKVAWLALEADDDEPSRFLYYLAHALQQGCGAGAAALDLLSETTLAAPQAVTAALINELAELEDEIFLFLDDYHYISHPLIHEAVSFFIQHAPAQFHLVVVTRAEPALHLARLRVQNQVLEIDTATLRFSFDETRSFLEQEQSSQIDPAHVRQLHSTTEGWPAALRIAASAALWQRDDIGRHVHALPAASRPFAAYLEDMLARLPEETVQFMSRSAILDHLTAPLCAAITGVAASQDLLTFLSGRQLLLEPLDQEGNWFRYHHLLREYLYRRLEARFGGELSNLHRNAYRWFAAHEMWTDATKHAIAAGDLNEATSLVENCAMGLVTKGDLQTLLGWQRLLPAQLMRGQVRVRLAIAWGMTLAMRGGEAEAMLAGIEADIAAGAIAGGEPLSCECSAIRSVLAAFADDSARAVALAESCLSRNPADAWTANVLSNVLRFCYWKGGRLDLFYATPWLPYSLEEDRRNVFSSVYRLTLQGLVEFQQLRIDVAERHGNEAMRLAERHVGPHSAAAALPANLLAQIRYEQGQLQQAESLIADRLPTMNAVGMIEHLIRSYVVLARISAHNMNLERAYALLEQAETLGHTRGWSRVIATVLLERLRLFLGEGRNFEASACLVRMERIAAQHPVDVRCAHTELHELLALGRAAMACADNDPSKAVTWLEPLYADCLAGHNLFLSLRAGTALAAALFASDRLDQAMQLFREVLRRAASAGIVQVILDQGADVTPLLLRLRDGPAHTNGQAAEPGAAAYAAQLLAGLHTADAAPPAAGVRESLSPRECSILQLIAENQSNKEIARTLGITPETVKSHLKNIFAKLDVTKRHQAVQCAQAMGLVV